LKVPHNGTGTEIESFYQKAKLTPNIVGLRNGVQTAIAIIVANFEARESIGTLPFTRQRINFI
jgi:hypothetical protein